MKKRSMYFRMITASLMRRRSRMIVALLAITIGAAILSGLVTIYYDVPRQMGAEFRNYGANMIFTAENLDFTMQDIDKGKAVIKSDELVGIAPYHYESVRINDISVMAAATDMKGAKKTSPFWSVSGAWPEQKGELMVGKSVAETFRLREGDTVTVTYTPDGVTGTETEEDYVADNMLFFKVTSILVTGGSEENYIYMSLEDMEELTGKEVAFDICELSVSATSDKLSAYAKKISNDVEGINARLVKKVTQSEATVLGKLQSLVLLVTVIVLALTMICVATTMTAVVAERRKEIGLKKALGAADMSIIREFMGEELLLGAIGGTLGAGLGFIFAQYISMSVFNSSISFRVLLLPVTIIISVIVTGISCLFPIRSATNVDPALVLNGE